MQDKTTHRMLKINEALLLASSEEDVLAAVSLYVDPDATLSLLYLDWEETAARSMTVVARWKDGQPIRSDALAVTYAVAESPALASFVSALVAQDAPVLFFDDVARAKLALPPFLQDARSLILIKLQGIGSAASQEWPGLICLAWSSLHSPDDEEKWLCLSIFQFASAVVSNLHMYQQTRQHNAQLRELDRLKDEFLYSISHELRTPLVGIISLAELILYGAEGDINSVVQKDVQIILQSGEHLLALVTDILDLARMEAGTFHLQRERLHLDQVITAAVQTIDTRGLSVQVRLAPDLPPVLADKTRVQQILINLLSNAVKFAGHGEIEIRAWVEGQAVITAVRDEGIGIRPEHQDLIFEKFRQVDGSITRKQGGVGLGLPISKRLVELQGGRMWLTSAPGQGSTFYFSLPLAIDDSSR